MNLPALAAVVLATAAQAYGIPQVTISERDGVRVSGRSVVVGLVCESRDERCSGTLILRTPVRDGKRKFLGSRPVSLPPNSPTVRVRMRLSRANLRIVKRSARVLVTVEERVDGEAVRTSADLRVRGDGGGGATRTLADPNDTSVPLDIRRVTVAGTRRRARVTITMWDRFTAADFAHTVGEIQFQFSPGREGGHGPPWAVDAITEGGRVHANLYDGDAQFIGRVGSSRPDARSIRFSIPLARLGRPRHIHWQALTAHGETGPRARPDDRTRFAFTRLR
jgi:hypothetical protein